MVDRELQDWMDRTAMTGDDGKQALHLVVTARFHYFRDDVGQARQDVVACLRDYLDMTESHMTLWAMHGRDKRRFDERSFETIANTYATLPHDRAMQFHVISARSKIEAASFSVDALDSPKWEIDLGKKHGRSRGISDIGFRFPLAYFAFSGQDFTRFFDRCAERLRPFYGYGGIGPGMPFDSMKINYLGPTLFMLAWAMPELEIEYFPSSTFMHEGLRPVSWSMALGREEIESVGGPERLRQELSEADGFRLYEHLNGLTIRAGAEPMPGRRLFGTWEEFLAGQPAVPSFPADILGAAGREFGEDFVAALRRMTSGQMADIPKAPRGDYPLLYKLAGLLKPLRATDPYQLQSDFYGLPYFDKARTLQYYARFDE